MDRVIWRKGGIQRSSGTWDPALGKTGFYKNRRIIEEPNPLSIYLRKMLTSDPSGHFCFIDGVESGITSYEEVIDTVLSQSSRHNLVVLHLVSNAISSQARHHKSPWIILRPIGRMTPHETWVVDASDPTLAKKELVDD